MSFNDKKSAVYNSISKKVKENAAFIALWNNFTANSDYSEVEAIIRLVEYISPHHTFLLIKNMIKEHIFPDKLLRRLCNMLSVTPYQIGRRDSDIDSFKDFVMDISVNSHRYEQETLMQFARSLELLFAYGYRELKESISIIYGQLPYEDIIDERYSIHYKLIGVYKYNSMNYSALYDMLIETLEYCKASRKKDLYGEVYYYFAVLNVLSGGTHLYDLTLYIDKSCQHMYPMATVLKNHYNI